MKQKITKTKKTTKKPVRKTARKLRVTKPRTKIVKLEGEKDIKDIRAEIERAVKLERDKRLILWSGVTFFMVVIFVFWIFNLKQTFKQIESSNSQNQEFNLNKITDDFSKTMEEMKGNLADIKEFAEIPAEVSTSTEDKIGTSSPFVQPNQEEIDELKARLEELENRIEAGE